MAESYKTELEGRANVELVHVSRDSSEGDMERFFEPADPTFAAVRFSRVDSLKVAMQHYGNGVPHYVLVDADGKLLAEGKEASFAKAKQLTASGD